MSCSLLNPALGYMFLRGETALLLIKLPSLELGTHGKKSVSTCGIVNTEQQWKWRSKCHFKPRGWFSKTWCWTKEVRDKRTHGLWIHFYQVQKHAKLASRFQSWWDSRSNWPCHLKQGKEADQIHDLTFNHLWHGRQAALACDLWEKGNEWGEPGNIQSTAWMQFANCSTGRSPNTASQSFWVKDRDKNLGMLMWLKSGEEGNKQEAPEICREVSLCLWLSTRLHTSEGTLSRARKETHPLAQLFHSSAAVNICAQVFCGHRVSLLLHIYLGVEVLSQMVTLGILEGVGNNWWREASCRNKKQKRKSYVFSVQK